MCNIFIATKSNFNHKYFNIWKENIELNKLLKVKTAVIECN